MSPKTLYYYYYIEHVVYYLLHLSPSGTRLAALTVASLYCILSLVFLLYFSFQYNLIQPCVIYRVQVHIGCYQRLLLALTYLVVQNKQCSDLGWRTNERTGYTRRHCGFITPFNTLHNTTLSSFCCSKVITLTSLFYLIIFSPGQNRFLSRGSHIL